MCNLNKMLAISNVSYHEKILKNVCQDFLGLVKFGLVCVQYNPMNH